jgi:hypothetical protein
MRIHAALVGGHPDTLVQTSVSRRAGKSIAGGILDRVFNDIIKTNHAGNSKCCERRRYPADGLVIISVNT